MSAQTLLRLLDEFAPAEAFEALAADPDDVARALRIRQRLDEHHQRERELLALSDTARDVTALRDVDRVLRAINRRARELLGTDISYLVVADPERGDFYVRVSDGTVTPDFEGIRVPPGFGVGGYVARTKQPFFSNDYFADERFGHLPSIDASTRAEGLRSLLGAPLLVDDEVIGVLAVADRFQRAFSAQQIGLLSSLAAHAAVALENARLFEEAHAALESARRYGAQVRAAAEVHEQLTALLARGGELEDLARVTAEHLGGAVAVVDGSGRPLTGVDATRVLPPVAALRESREQGRAVTLQRGDGWVAVAQSSADFEAGVVLWTDAEPSPFMLRTLERSAILCALVLLSQERVETAEHRLMTDLVGALLRRDDSDLPRLRREAARRGLELAGPLVVIVCERPSLRGAGALRAARAALEPHRALVGEVGDELVAIVGDATGADAARALQRALSASLERPACVALARAVDDTGALAGAHRTASRCLRLTHALGREGAIASETELAPFFLLFDGRSGEDVDAYLRATLGPLARRDDARQGELAETLLVYLEHGRVTRSAAAVLHIHPNTLRQRLESVERLLPDWDAPERRLDVHLGLRLLRLRG